VIFVLENGNFQLIVDDDGPGFLKRNEIPFLMPLNGWTQAATEDRVATGWGLPSRIV